MSKKCDGVELVDNRLLWLLEVSPQQLKSPQKTKPRKTLGPTKKSKHIEGQGSTENPCPQKIQVPKKGRHKITWIRRFPIRQVWQGRRILLKSLARACCVWKIERSTSFSKSSHLCFESQTAVYCVLCAALNCCPGKRPNWTSGLAGPTFGTVWSRLWKGANGYDRLLITYDHLHDHVIMKISTNPT